MGAFNCFMIVICCEHLVCFTDMISRESQYGMGYSLISWLFIFFCVNLFYFGLEFVRILRILLLKHFGIELYVPKIVKKKETNSESE